MIHSLDPARISIGRFSVTKPVLINILMITLLVLGAFSLVQLPQEQFAEVPFYWVNIITAYPGTSAEDVESSVTVPIENSFSGISKLKAIASTTTEGLSVVRVEFDDGISNEEFRTLYQDAQTRVSQVSLPEGTLDPAIDDFSSADFLPVIEVILSGNMSYEQLYQQTHYLKERILQVQDVSDVNIVGLPDRQILVNADPKKLESLGLSMNELSRAIQRENSVVPGGTLSSGSREYLLRTLGSIRTSDDISQVTIRRGSDKVGSVTVGDVAEVVDGFDPDSLVQRYDGETSVSLKVIKVPGGSSVSVVDGITSIVNESRADSAFAGTLSLFNDSTVQIASSLSVLAINAGIGLAILFVVLTLFIGLRNAAMTALGIPVSFAITFIILDYLGETINTNTLFGLVLVLGLIVDHAIVVIENSYRLRLEGYSREESAILGTDQVVWPVIAATGTTVAAFLPLMIIPGTIGKFLRVIPLTVTIALLASTAESLVILPSHFADWGKRREQKRLARGQNRASEAGKWFHVVQSGYSRMLSGVYRFKKSVLFLAFAVTVGSFALVGYLNTDLFSAEDFSYFTIDIKTPTGSSIEMTDSVVRAFEEVLFDPAYQSEISSISSTVGASSSSATGNASNLAEITVDLYEQDEGRVRSIDEIIEDVRQKTFYITGVDDVFYRKAQNGPPTAAPIGYRLSGDDYNELIAASEALKGYLGQYPELNTVESDYEKGSPELQIVLNTERASALGVDVATIGSFIRSRYDGIETGVLFENNIEVPIVVRTDLSESDPFSSLEQSLIPTSDGRFVPFSSVADIELSSSYGSIRRTDGTREIQVTANTSEGVDTGSVDSWVQEHWDETLSLHYPGVSFSAGGDFAEFNTLLLEILRVFLIGIFLIYLILGAQFNSYSQPLLILLSIPFAFVGVILFLVVSGTPFSTTVLYAGVALAGIAVNDAIVLISFINDLRKEGMSVEEAVKEGAKKRIRPILLTSLTTIGGLLPTSLGIGGTSVVWGPMASTIMFGLIFSTISALLIIPLLYGLLYDRKRTERGGEA